MEFIADIDLDEIIGRITDEIERSSLADDIAEQVKSDFDNDDLASRVAEALDIENLADQVVESYSFDSAVEIAVENAVESAVDDALADTDLAERIDALNVRVATLEAALSAAAEALNEPARRQIF